MHALIKLQQGTAIKKEKKKREAEREYSNQLNNLIKNRSSYASLCSEK